MQVHERYQSKYIRPQLSKKFKSQNVDNNHILAKNCFMTPKNKFSIDKQ